MTQSSSPGWTPDHHHRADPPPWTIDQRTGAEPGGGFRYLSPAQDASPRGDFPAHHAGHPGPVAPDHQPYGWGTEPAAPTRHEQPGFAPTRHEQPGFTPQTRHEQPGGDRAAPWQQPQETGGRRGNAAEWFARPDSAGWSPGPAWRRDEAPRETIAPPAPDRPAPQPSLSPLIRGQALDRMRRANRNHVRAGLENLGTARACGPYCLTLVSVERRGFARISLASRLDDDDPDHYDLTELLADVYGEARAKRTEARRAGRRWDPRTPLEGIVLRSEDINEHTELIGVGVSMLDLPDLPWAVAKRSWEKTWQGDRAMASTKLGGQIKLWLVDGTAIHTVRHEDTPDEINTTAAVDIARTARLDPDLVTRGTAQGDPTWQLLKQLLDVLTES